MMTHMDDTEITTLEQVRQVLAGPKALAFRGSDKAQRNAWIETVLKRLDYFELKRGEKGEVNAYLQRLSGMSRAQITRLIARFLRDGAIRPSQSPRNRFPAKYTRADQELLARTDNAHARLSGPATKKILERQFAVYGDARFRRLQGISSAHIYRLRQSRVYREHALTLAKTKSVNRAIGQRRKPDPRGRPGFLRVDTVHQGDLDGQKGVYHINMVDEVTQWEIVACVAAISEAHLTPILEAALVLFPFVIVNFHSDNGGEFINGPTSKLLNKLLVEQTKSRSGRTNDNALIESKNGSVIRKHMGFSHIDRAFAPLIDRFYLAHFNAYLNFHRPCAFATVTFDGKGRRRRKYETYLTPFERLKSLTDASNYLRGGVTMASLDKIAAAQSDNAAAEAMQAALRGLFKRVGQGRACAMPIAYGARA